MKQADSSLFFLMLMKAWRDVFPSGPTLPFVKVRIYGDIKTSLLGKSSHKETSISVIFWTFLLGKLINSVDPQGST